MKTILFPPLKLKTKIPIISVTADMLIKLMKSEVSVKNRVCLFVLKTERFFLY